MVLLDGKALAKKIRAQIAEEVSQLEPKPKLVVVHVGSDPASEVYIRMKEKAAVKVGMDFQRIDLPEDVTQDELIKQIVVLNQDSSVTAMIVQLPLPKQLNKLEILSAIDPLKDGDCLNPHNIGCLSFGDEKITSCTPQGIIDLLDEYKIDLEGKSVLIVNRSLIIGRPLAVLMINRSATVTVAHSRTKNLPELMKQADIVVSAIGQPYMFSAENIKDGAVVIDVSISRMDEKLCGDFNPECLDEKASFYTPVPGGVGPMTVANLLRNTLKLHRLQKSA